MESVVGVAGGVKEAFRIVCGDSVEVFLHFGFRRSWVGDEGGSVLQVVNSDVKQKNAKNRALRASPRDAPRPGPGRSHTDLHGSPTEEGGQQADD